MRHVVDGDTFHLTNAARIRLLDIDAPERDKPNSQFAEQAADALRGMLMEASRGREVRLRAGPRVRDQYGRFVCYVFVTDARAPEGDAGPAEVFVNAEIVRRGLARARAYGRPGERFGEIVEAEEEAREARRGMWARREEMKTP